MEILKAMAAAAAVGAIVFVCLPVGLCALGLFKLGVMDDQDFYRLK